MKIKTICCLLDEFSSILLGRISHERGTIKAFKSYERKASRDFQRTNGIRLNKSQRIAGYVLLDIKNCSVSRDVIEVLKKHDYPDGYVLRFAHIWEYYEHVNIEQ